MLYSRKRDANESDHLKRWRDLGGSAFRILAAEKDAPDLVIGFQGLDALVEDKVPGKKPRKSQAEWHAKWRGRKVYVWNTLEDVMRTREEMGRESREWVDRHR
jgi:hypothetical protein